MPMTPAASTPPDPGTPPGAQAPARPRGLRAAAFRVFYGMPGRWRRRLVRLAVPTYTVGAVVLVRESSAAQRLLMVRQPPGTAWSLPAGLLRRRERPIDGATRELAEETGIALDAEDLRPAIPNAIVHSRGRWIDMIFTACVPPGTRTEPDGAEIIEVDWHPVETLPPVTVATAVVLAHYGLGPYADYPEVLQ